MQAAVVEDALRHDFDALAAISQIVRMMDRRGVLVMSGIAWDLLDSATADWFFLQRRALAAAGGGEAHRTIDGLRYWWRNELFDNVSRTTSCAGSATSPSRSARSSGGRPVPLPRAGRDRGSRSGT